MAKRYKYMGDMSLSYGGTFYDFSEWKWGYVSAVEVTDLDSATGFDGAVLIEAITINVERSGANGRADLERALQCIGATMLRGTNRGTGWQKELGDIQDNGRILKKHSAAWRFCLAYACQAYGYKDSDRSETLQLDKDQPMVSRDGWRADKRLRSGASLRNYVKREWLK